MSNDLLWLAARATGSASLVALTLSVLSGSALRGRSLSWLSTNRLLTQLHTFTTWLWLPLAAAHVVALIADPVAKIDGLDLLVPFRVTYGWFAIGLGTVALQLLAIVLLSTWLRRSLLHAHWIAFHRLSYAAFALTIGHSLLAGTDFSQPLLQDAAWATAMLVGLVVLGRIIRSQPALPRPIAEPRPGDLERALPAERAR